MESNFLSKTQNPENIKEAHLNNKFKHFFPAQNNIKLNNKLCKINYNTHDKKY